MLGHMSGDVAAVGEEDINDEAAVHDAAEDDGRKRQYPCHQCGANLQWKPGVQALNCPYCGHSEELPQDEKSISEYAFNDYIVTRDKSAGLGLEARSLHCAACGAAVDLAEDEAATQCPFCGSSAIDEQAHEERIQPEAIIPFAVERDEARRAFRQWLSTLWFAPSELKNVVHADNFQGVYRCWWTFDSHTMSHWSGQAGYYYYVTKTRTVNGKTETYRERKTRWKRRSGTCESFFDDELTPGFRDGLNAEQYRLHSLKPYDPAMLAGYLCERYVIDPKDAWPQAREAMEKEIYQTCKRRLGGDTQRFLRVSTAHRGITFKSVLLPAWHSAYVYKGRIYQLVVNGQNGHVTAERPYSWVKITFAALAAVGIILALYFIFTR